MSGELPQAERGRSPTGEHDREAAVGSDDGRWPLIDVCEAAVPGLRLFEAAIVEADYGPLARQRRPVPLVGFAAEVKPAGSPFAHGLGLSDGFGITQTDKRFGKFSFV